MRPRARSLYGETHALDHVYSVCSEEPSRAAKATNIKTAYMTALSLEAILSPNEPYGYTQDRSCSFWSSKKTPTVPNRAYFSCGKSFYASA